MIVLDASAVVELLLGLPAAAAVAERIAPDAETLHAPELLFAEVAQVVRRYERRGDIDERRGENALVDLVDLGIESYHHLTLVGRAWELRHDLSIYDALYVGLAEALGAPLLTLDAGLAGAPGHRARVEFVTG